MAKLSYVSGGHLPPPRESGAPETLTEALRCSTGRIIYVEAGNVREETYGELFERSMALLGGLQSKGMVKGSRVVLLLRNRRDHLGAFWACALGGMTPVTVAVPTSFSQSNAIVMKVGNIIKLLSSEKGRAVFIITQKNDAAELACLYSSLGRIVKLESLQKKATPPTMGVQSQIAPDDVLFLQLTSGSTGTPKCIQETHSGIINHIRGSQLTVGYSAGEVSMNWLPFDHVVPMLTTHLRDVYIGLDQIQVPTEEVLANPLIWLDVLAQFSVTYSWSPNFGFRLVADAIDAIPDDKIVSRDWNFSALRFLMNAGEQVTRLVVERFIKLTGIGAEKMQPSFGMAEVCTCMTYNQTYGPQSTHFVSKRSIDGLLEVRHPVESSMECLAAEVEFIDLGGPTAGTEIRICDKDGVTVLPEGHIGRFQIRGASVTPGYLLNEPANSASFVGGGWFDSGDLGYVFNRRLVLTGRAKETIVIRGANFFCYEIEDVVGNLECVAATFVAATWTREILDETETLLVFFSPEDFWLDQQLESVLSIDITSVEAGSAILQAVDTVRSHIFTVFGLTPVVVPTARKNFKKTTSGKIQRSLFKQLYESGHYETAVAFTELARQKSVPLQKIWFSQSAPYAPEEDKFGKVLLVLPDSRPRVPKKDVQSALRRSVTVLTLAALSGQLSSMAIDDVSLVIFDWRDEAAELDSTWEIVHLLQKLNSFLVAEVRLVLLTRGGASVSPADHSSTLTTAQFCRQSSICSVLRAVAPFCPWLSSTCLIDMEEENSLSGFQADLLVTTGRVAYRKGTRLVAGFTPACGGAPAFEVQSTNIGGKWIVLVGGSGGVGSALVTWLLAQDVRVCVVGRSARSASLPKEVVFWQANVESLDEISEAFLPLAQKNVIAVVHAAGTYSESAFGSLTRREWESITEPKCTGMIVLHEWLARHRPKCPLILFSSVASAVAGYPAPYAFANSFLEEFATFRAHNGFPTRAIAWPIWQNVGIAKGVPIPDPKAGFLSISARQGVAIFRAVLAQSPGDTSAVFVFGLKYDGHHVLPLVSGAAGAPLRKPVLVNEAVPWPGADKGAVQFVHQLLSALKQATGTSATPEQDFSSVIGLDSVTVVRFAGIASRLGCKVTPDVVFEQKSVHQLAAWLELHAGEEDSLRALEDSHEKSFQEFSILVGEPPQRLQCRSPEARDWPNILDFVVRNWDSAHPLANIDFFRWQSRGYARDDTEPPSTSLVLFDRSGAVHGWLLSAPAIFQVPVTTGTSKKSLKLVNGAEVFSWIVSKKLRGEAGSGIASTLVSIAQKRNQAIAVCGLNSNSIPVFQSLELAVLPQLHRYVIAVDSEGYSALVCSSSQKSPKNMIRCWKPLIGQPVVPLSWEKVDFDQLESLWREMTSQARVIGIYRSADFWRWRYAKSIGYNYFCFGDSEKEGIVICRIQQIGDSQRPLASELCGKSALVLLELVPRMTGGWSKQILPMNVPDFLVLLAQILQWALELGCVSADFSCSSSRFAILLASLGFVKQSYSTTADDTNLPMVLGDISREMKPLNAAMMVRNGQRHVFNSEVADWSSSHLLKSTGDMDRPMTQGMSLYTGNEGGQRE